MISDAELEEWGRLEKVGTRRPWLTEFDVDEEFWCPDHDDGECVIAEHGFVAHDMSLTNVRFICTMRNAFPRLLAEVRRLRVEHDSLFALLKARNDMDETSREMAELRKSLDLPEEERTK